MTSNTMIQRGLRAALLLAACASLGGCAIGGAVRDLFDDDDDDNPNAPPQSERIAVLTSDQVLTLDPEAAGPVTLPAPYINPSWPQTGGAPTHAMQNPAAAGSLARAWKRSIGDGDGRNSRITAQPVIEAGRVFVMDGRGRIGAYDARTGSEVWTARPRVANDRDAFGFGGGIAVANGRVYVSSGVGLIAALDAADGRMVWSLETSIPMRSAPTVADGRVFAVSDDNVLMAVDAATGERLWSFQGIAEPARLLTSPAPAVLNDVVVVPFGSGELLALNAVTGQPIWEDTLTRAGALAPISTLNDVAGSPVIYDNVVYAMNHSGVLAAISLDRGERIWTLPAGGVHMPWLAGDALFVMTTEAQLVAVDRHTGVVKWLTQLPGFKNEERRREKISWAGPTLLGGRIAVASSRGQGLYFDPATGEQIGEFEPGKTFVAPVVADQTLYVLNSDGELSAYR